MFRKLRIQKTRPDPNRVLKKSLIALMIGCFLLGMATRSEVENAREEAEKDTIADTLTQAENRTEKGYRIEVGKVKLRGEEEEEIRFISPEGNVVKDIQLNYSVSKAGDLWHIESTNLEAISEDKSRVIISEESRKSRYNPDELTDYPGYEGKIWDYTVKLMNATGEVEFTKQIKTFPGNDPTASYFKTLFSRQGNAVLFFYRDSEHIFHIEVYDTEGNKLAEVSSENYLSDLQISPDGKIVGAETEKKVGKAWLRHLFFLDVETSKTKVVKSEGKGWGVSMILSENRTEKPDEILLILRKGSKPVNYRYENASLTFDKIPEDLSTLFGD